MKRIDRRQMLELIDSFCQLMALQGRSDRKMRTKNEGSTEFRCSPPASIFNLRDRRPTSYQSRSSQGNLRG